MLRLKTLGGLTISDGAGATKSLPGQRVALLATLVVVGDRGVPRDRAAGLLWPDSTEENARHSLGQALYALRRDASSSDVVVGTDTLRLNSDVVSCDAWELESHLRSGELDEAVRLYAGPFLDGVRLRASAELERLVDAERHRLARLYLDALDALARIAASRGDTAQAITLRRRAAAVDPLSSRVALELVRALAEMGDKSAALQAARVHESLVRQELETDPDPAFVAYTDELRASSAATTKVRGEPAEPEHREPVVRVEASLPPSTVSAQTSTTRRLRWPLWTFGALAAAAVAFVGAQRYLDSAPSVDPKRVYVARFENRTGNPALAPVGAMVSDWVAQGLERGAILRVVATPRLAAGLDDHEALDSTTTEATGATSGAGTIVAGAYYAIGDSLRFHVEISDIAGKEVLASFDVTALGVADPTVPMELVRQRTVGALASLFDPRLESWVRIATKPPTYEAYREFVTGQRIWASDYQRALTHFDRAVALDSSFYAARVEAAILHRLLGACDRTEAIARQLAPLRERLAPFDYHMINTQLALCAGQWERAYDEARTIAELRPGSPFLDYGVALQALQLGRREEASELLGRHPLARGVAEIGPNYAVVTAVLHGTRGDFDRGIEVARWAQARFPTFAGAHVIEAVLLSRAGRVAETERALDSIAAVALRPPLAAFTALRRIPTVFLLAGDTAAAQRGLARALRWLDARPADERGHESYRFELANMFYDHGRLDEARAILSALYEADTANVDYRAYLGLIAARRGDSAAAAQTDRWLAGSRAPYVFTRTLYRARLAAASGRRDDALALLGPALDEVGRFTTPLVAEMIDFAALRDDPRFRTLLGLR